MSFRVVTSRRRGSLARDGAAAPARGEGGRPL